MDPCSKKVKCGVRKFTGYSSKILNTFIVFEIIDKTGEILNTLCPEKSDVDSASDDSSVSVVCEVTFALVV